MSEPATSPDPASPEQPAPAAPAGRTRGYQPPPHLRRYLRRLP